MSNSGKLRLPHPVILLVIGVVIAATLTWLLPAGEFERRDDPVTHKSVVVAGTYHAVPRAPVGPFATVVAIPRGFVEAADVIAVVLFVGGAWVVVDRIGLLGRLVGWLVGAFRDRGLVAIPVLSLFFATMGALENMQEEIIPLIPVLLVLGQGLGIDAVAVVAMSAGAAMVGSAFGPTNPFQAGIAMKLAQLPAGSAAIPRMVLFIIALVAWIALTWRHARRHRLEVLEHAPAARAALSTKDAMTFLIVIAPLFAYVYGSIALDWGFNELSAGFIISGTIAGLIGGLGFEGTTLAYLEGMQSLLPAAVLIGVARSISLVLADGHVIDTILQQLATPLTHLPATVAALLMIPAQSIVHVPVPSVSGQAVLTMPVFVPLSDLLGFSRQITVLAFQLGAGLTELVTPTNGALMAVLLAAGVTYQRWLRFAFVATLVVLGVGVAGLLVAMLR